MAGYTRVDTINNIADGNVINAADLDGEFDGIQAAFNSSTGHNHDGTAGEGAPILALGPVQDVTISTTVLGVKTTNTVDIGTTGLRFKDFYLAGNASVSGTLGVTGVATLTAQPVLSSLTASQAVFTDASKGLVSNAITGTGNVVMSASPTLTGTLDAAAATFSGAVTLGDASADAITVNGTATFNASPIISVTDNTNAALRITQLGTGNALLVEDSTNPDSSPFVIDASGTAILGSTSSSAIGSITSVAQVNHLGATTSGISIANWGSAGTNSPRITFGRSPSNAVGTQTAVLSGSNLMQLQAYGSDGTAFVQAAEILVQVDGTPGTNDMPGRLVFSTTADGGTTPTERMRIDSAGQTKFSYNAVIETTDNTNAALRITQLGTGNALLVEDSANPDSTPFVIDSAGNVIQGTTASATGGLSGQTYQQHVTASISSAGALFAGWNATQPNSVNIARSTSGTIGSFTTAPSGTASGIKFFFDDGTAFIRAASIDAAVDGTAGTNDMPGRLVFSTTADGASTPTERMRIDSAGRVGIGSTSLAGYRLRVAGTFETTGTVGIGVSSDATIPSNVTTNAYGFYSSINTAASAFTLGVLHHFRAVGQTPGAGSTVTSQFGFHADNGLTGATNNYGFYGAIASGTGRYNFYAAGTAENFFGGNTVVSVTDNTNAALRITQLGTGNALLVEDSTNPDSTPFVIDANGFVVRGHTGIITTSSGTGGIQSLAQGTSVNNGYSAITAVDNTGSSKLAFSKSRGNTFAAQTIVVSGDNLGRTIFEGYDGANFISGAEIAAQVDGTPGTNDMPGRLVFSTTADGASTPTERMRIDSAGNVGIGATAPITKLEVAGNNNITWSVTASITGTTMDVTAVATSGVAVGDLVFGANIQAYTRVTALGTGTGGIGTYTVSVSQTAASGSVTGGATYGNTLIRITDTDTAQNIGQPTGGLQFFTSDGSSPTAGVGAYVAALAESVTPDTALVFGTRDNGGGGIDANERMRIDSSGNVVIGYTATIAGSSSYIPPLQVSTGNTNNSGVGLNAFSAGSGISFLHFNRSKSNTIGTNTLVSNSDILGTVRFSGADGTNYIQAASITAAVDGTPGTNDMPGRLIFSTTADGASTPTERMRIDSSGNVLVTNPAGLGYGTGSGGTVTQATSKTTAVTLNKPTGQITMNNAALAANTTVGFTLNNTLITATDTILVNNVGGNGGNPNYQVWIYIVQAGSCLIAVRNISGGSLSEAVVINFTIIKGATS